MKKNLKKTMGILLMSTMAATALNGCSDAGKSTETVTSIEETEKNEATETTEKPITLRFLTWQSNHEKENQAVADAYHEKNPNVTVNFEYLGDMNSRDYLTKTDIMLMGGEPIDILMTPGYMQYAVRADSGSYLPLDQFFEADGTTAEDEYNVIVRVNEQTYGIPTEMKYKLMLINKDMLDAVGLPVPELDWTWDEYREYAKKLTSGSGANTIYGSYFHSWGNENLAGLGSAKKGSSYFNDDKTLAFTNPRFAEFLQLRYDMENVDKCSTPLADVKALNMNYRDQFFNGKIGMLDMGTTMLSDIGNEKYKHDFVTTFARMPLWEKGDEHYNIATANIFSIAKTSEHPREAFDFLKFWSTEGVAIKGMFMSNEKNADRMERVGQMVKDFENLVDIEALKKIMQDEKWVDSYEEFTPNYQSEIDSILTEETDKFLLGSQSLDETVNKIMERGNAVIEENQ